MTSLPELLSDPDALELLTCGALTVQGQLASASNTTLYAEITWQGQSAHCVYKPTVGERPLWDFPVGTLSKREVAAYLMSAATGWDIVPPTVWREGPFGVGSVQLWVEPADDSRLIDVVKPQSVPPGWLTVVRAEGRHGEPVLLVHADDPRLARMAVFDAVIDNADRKAGHVLRAGDGHLWGVDHGVTFNVEDKLRTVLWGFAGSPLPQEAGEVLRELRAGLADDSGFGLRTALSQLLGPAEIQRTAERVDRLLTSLAFPMPLARGPVIPWPPW